MDRKEWDLFGIYTSYTRSLMFNVSVLRWRHCVVRTGWSFMLRVEHGFCISLESRIRSPEMNVKRASTIVL